MLFNLEQIEQILHVVDLNAKYLGASIIGLDVLPEKDKEELKKWGFDLKLIEQQFPTFMQSYYWGRLSEFIGDYHASRITYNDFLGYLNKGQYQPLTQLEKEALEIAKKRSYGHITGLGEGMKKDITNAINQTEQQKRSDYEKVIKEELERGVADRNSLKQIVSELGHKTGDWSRNFGRIVDTEMNNIFQEGRAAQVRRREGGEAKVYKDVYPLACKWCIKHYLTNGIGSQPRLFTLNELEANGSNIGKKVNDWQPTLYSLHPWCRCNLHKLIPGQEWDEETQSFKFKKKDEKSKWDDLPKIKVTINNKTIEV